MVTKSTNVHKCINVSYLYKSSMPRAYFGHYFDLLMLKYIIVSTNVILITSHTYTYFFNFSMMTHCIIAT